MVRCVYQTETDVIKMEKRFTTEEMGKMVLEQAKGESLVNYMRERFAIWFINVQDRFVEIFVDDNELGIDEDTYRVDEEMFDRNFYVHDELLKKLGIDLSGEEVSWVMEHSQVVFYPLSYASELGELSTERFDRRWVNSVYSEDLQEILDDLVDDLANP